jgi:hypothetical protein
MGRFSKEEIEGAFRRYQVQGRDAARSGDWARWGKMFTEDVTYIEQQVGQWGGREAAVREMAALMHQTEGTPWVWVNQYPVKSYIVDEDRGWVWSQIWNRMEDPGNGVVLQENCLTMLRYDGDGLFNYEEDLYNPHAFERMVKEWITINETCKAEQKHSAREARAAAAATFAELDAGEPATAPPLARKYAQARAELTPRGRFPRQEIEEAFDHYRKQLALSGKTTDWSHWGAALTKDATWIDCALGHLGKREAIVREVEARLHQVDDDAPWVQLCRFPADEYISGRAFATPATAAATRPRSSRNSPTGVTASSRWSRRSTTRTTSSAPSTPGRPPSSPTTNDASDAQSASPTARQRRGPSHPTSEDLRAIPGPFDKLISPDRSWTRAGVPGSLVLIDARLVGSCKPRAHMPQCSGRQPCGSHFVLCAPAWRRSSSSPRSGLAPPMQTRKGTPAWSVKATASRSNTP